MPDMDELLAKIPPEEAAKLPSDLSDGLWRMIETRGRRIAELESAISHAARTLESGDDPLVVARGLRIMVAPRRPR